MQITRRQFLSTAVTTLAVAAGPWRAAEAATDRALRFDNLHTGERLAVEYFSRGEYLPDALDAVNHLLRDFRTGDVHTIDPSLLDVLYDVRHNTGSGQPFQVISGYRSPATNAALRRHSEGVAAGSLHMQGQAIDVRLGDVPLRKLQASARARRAGGVGYYPASNFVHVDTGRVRYW